MNNIFTLEVSTLGGLQRLLFPDYESAKTQMDLLQSELDKDKYVANSGKDKRENTFVIVSQSGPMVVVLEQVHTVRIIDLKKYDELAEIHDNLIEEKIVKKEVTKKRAMLELERAYK